MNPSLFVFKFIQQVPDFLQLFLRRLLVAQQLHHEGAGGTVVHRVYKTVQQVALGLLLIFCGHVDMLHAALISFKYLFLHHDLHELQCGGVIHFPLLFVEPVVYKPNGGRPVLPEYLQDLQFRFSRVDMFLVFLHDPKVGIISYEQSFILGMGKF